MKNKIKIPLIVFGSLFALLLILSLIASPIAKNYVQKHDKELIGRELSIGRICVNPFLGSAKIKDLTIFEDDGTTSFVNFDLFEAKIRLWDLFKHRVWVKKISVSGLKLNVEQNYKWFNFNSLIDHLSTRKPKFNTIQGFGFVINNATIEDSDFRYADLAMGNEFLMRDIAIQIPSLDGLSLKTQVGLDLCLSDNTMLHTDLHLSENAKEYSINLKLSNLDLDIIEPYLQQYVAFDSLKGALSMDLMAQGHTEHILDFDMNGEAVIKGFALQDKEGTYLGKIDSVFAKIERFNLNDRVLDFEKLHFSGLNTVYIFRADSTSNFGVLFSNKETAPEEQKEDTVAIGNEENTWKFAVADLKLDQSRLLYEDYTLPEVFQYEISDISLDSKQFTFEGRNAIQLQALLNKVGHLQLNWQGSFQDTKNQNLTLMLSNVKISDFSPYSVQLLGFPLEDGTLSFRSQNIITNGNLNGINKLQVASPKIGDKVKLFRPRYDKVPLKLGFYMLSDKRNNVSIDLPVSGNLNDPTFSYKKTLMQAFSNLLYKVATSPFRLLTDEEDNLQYIPFDPLQFDFTPEEYIMIDNVVANLYSHPNLGIVLEARVNYEKTLQQLCIKQLQSDYYYSLHPEQNPLEMDFMTNEAIRSIKLNDKGLCDFAVQHSKKRKLHSKKDVVSVAEELYFEKSEKLLPQLMANWNDLLSNYLWKVKGLTPEQISVTMMDESLMKSFTKTSRYEMHVFVYEDVE